MRNVQTLVWFLLIALLLSPVLADEHLVTPATPSAANSDRERNPLDLGGESCAAAYNIEVLPFTDNGLTCCQDDCPGAPFLDVYYLFIPPVSGVYVAGICDANPDVMLRAYPNGVCCDPGNWVDASIPCGTGWQLQIPLVAGAPIYFEIGNQSPSAPPSTYVFTLDTAPQGVPQIQLSTHHEIFAPLPILSVTSAIVMVSNAGNADLIVDNITTTGNVWSVSPTEMILIPGEERPLTINFQPTFEHDFIGTVELFSNDPARPRDSISVSGTGCRPVAPPPAPLLYGAGSPNAIYFAMPWDPNNGKSTLCSVEYSADGFNTIEAVNFFGPGSEPFGWWWWGNYGPGMIQGLEPNTTYEVRLRARDCTGAEAVGAATSMTTPPSGDIDEGQFELVIHHVAPGMIELNWNPVVLNSNGDELEVSTFIVRRHTTFGDPGVIEAYTEASSIQLPTTEHDISFFTVQAELTGNYDQPSPFIAWPPDGATVAGLNTVSIMDPLHKQQWDSFRVEVNSVVVRSNLDNAWGESGRTAAVVDFELIQLGLTSVSAIVVDKDGQSHTSTIVVNNVPVKRSQFTAVYDPSTHVFTADTANTSGLTGGEQFLWYASTGTERYDRPITLEWKPEFDSLVVLRPVVVEPSIVLIEETSGLHTEDPLEPYALYVSFELPTIPRFLIKCCCDNMVLRTAGNANGNYGGVKNFPLGPRVFCDPATREYEIGFSFELEVTIKWEFGDEFVECYTGQDCKRTSITDYGDCDADDNFVPLDPAVSDTSHKQHGGNSYPRDGDSWGNDDYRPDRHGETWDNSQLILGKRIRWIDIPSVSGTRPSGYALRDRRNAIFSARVNPQCEPVNIICCRQWELRWDVTICPGCVITQTIPPEIFNEVTPADCPTLAD